MESSKGFPFSWLIWRWFFHLPQVGYVIVPCRVPSSLHHTFVLGPGCTTTSADTQVQRRWEPQHSFFSQREHHLKTLSRLKWFKFALQVVFERTLESRMVLQMLFEKDFQILTAGCVQKNRRDPEAIHILQTAKRAARGEVKMNPENAKSCCQLCLHFWYQNLQDGVMKYGIFG